jgi:1,4-dihydroxy-6-naphthoate synthase
MSEDVMRQHINLYVNDFSFALNEEGKNAVEKLVEIYHQLHSDMFIDQYRIFINEKISV